MTDKHTGRAGLNVPFPVTKTLSDRLSEAQTEKNEKECCDMMERIRQQVFTGTLRCAATLVAAGALLASCTKEYDGPISSSAERELHFSVSQQGEADAERAATRAMPVETDDFHKSFGVFGYSYPSGSEWTQVAPKFMYNIEASREDGTDYATADTYFVPGEGTDVTFLAYAPYKAEGLTVPQKEITGAPTYAYTVPADVTKQSDLCFAAPVTLTGGTEDGTVRLTFAHALTAVSFVEGSEMAQGTITGISLKGLYGSATYNTGNTETNKWTSFSTPDSEFSQMLNVSVPNSEGKAITSKEQTFMLLPQTLGDGAELVIDYTPLNEEPRTLTASLKGREWEPGTHVTYAIKIAPDDPYTLVIESVEVNQWTEGITIEIESDPAFMADRLKIGDYLYDDGTWGDGGLRRIREDGSYEIADPKPKPKNTSSKKVVGIVYATYKDNPELFNEEDVTALKAIGTEPHGIAMATEFITWKGDKIYAWHADGNKDVAAIANCATKKQTYGDRSGWYNSKAVKAHSDLGNFHAFDIIFQHGEDIMVKKEPLVFMTDWFLPSAGQWWDILSILGGVEALKSETEQTSQDTGDFTWQSDGSVIEALNAWMEPVVNARKDKFTDGEKYWSSSEYDSNGKARYWQINDNSVECNSAEKGTTMYVRPILIF